MIEIWTKAVLVGAAVSFALADGADSASLPFFWYNCGDTLNEYRRNVNESV